MGAVKRNFCISITLMLLAVVTAGAWIDGKREGCKNEGERVRLDDIDKKRCFSCICKNGFVECDYVCPRVDECYFVVQDSCCHRCKGCIYNGIYHPSHTEWTSSTNPCKVFRCEAGVVTQSDLHCHTPCANPLPPEPGKCCATCPECKINGQIASDDRDVISDDPCLKCRCSQGKMICSKKACPVLQCTSAKQYHIPGECCPRCNGSRTILLTPNNVCTFQLSLHKEGYTFNVDKCTNCTCKNETSICTRLSCPILDCAPEWQKPDPGSCCKKCIMPQELQTQCSYNGVLYEDGQQWKLDSCKSCKCQRGMPSCAITKCNTTCAAGTRLVYSSEECCPKCVEAEGACMVFGDPHYKSFDGKIYSFKGVGKYLLTSDCHNNTFSIKVANVNKASSSSTKRVNVQYGNIRLNLQQKSRIKYNGKLIKEPLKIEDKFRLEKIKDVVEVTLQNGVKLFWNGKSFLEVTVPASFKNKLCGLCGNFNSYVQDDLKTREGRIVTDKEILNFGTSWCVGKRSDCAKKIKPMNKAVCTNKQRNERNLCKLFNSRPFAACESKLNYSKYYKACKMDMCHCPDGKCFCESLMAYARECKRLGVDLPNWQRHSHCDAESLKRPITYRKSHKSHQKNNGLYSKYIPRNLNKTRGPIPIQ